MDGSNYWAIDKYEGIVIPHVEAVNSFSASSAATSTGKSGDLVIVWTIEQPLNMADTWLRLTLPKANVFYKGILQRM